MPALMRRARLAVLALLLVAPFAATPALASAATVKHKRSSAHSTKKHKKKAAAKRGPRGKRGARGPVGPMGLTGANGANGANGATGPEGPAGPGATKFDVVLSPKANDSEHPVLTTGPVRLSARCEPGEAQGSVELLLREAIVEAPFYFTLEGEGTHLFKSTGSFLNEIERSEGETFEYSVSAFMSTQSGTVYYLRLEENVNARLEHSEEREGVVVTESPDCVLAGYEL